MEKKRKAQDYMKYSSLGIQMMVIVLLFAFGGKWLDNKAGNKTPIFTAILALSGVVISLIYVVRETTRDKSDK
jgi:ATP synthase protein I